MAVPRGGKGYISDSGCSKWKPMPVSWSTGSKFAVSKWRKDIQCVKKNYYLLLRPFADDKG